MKTVDLQPARALLIMYVKLVEFLIETNELEDRTCCITFVSTVPFSSRGLVKSMSVFIAQAAIEDMFVLLQKSNA